MHLPFIHYKCSILHVQNRTNLNTNNMWQNEAQGSIYGHEFHKEVRYVEQQQAKTNSAFILYNQAYSESNQRSFSP